MDNQEWTIQRKPKGQSRIDNPETLATEIIYKAYIL